MAAESYALGSALLFAGLILMVKVHGLHDWRKPGVLTVMFVAHVTMHVVPAVVLATTTTEYGVPQFFLVNCFASLMIPIGGIVGFYVLRASRISRCRFWCEPAANTLFLRKVTFFALVVLLVFCMILLGSYVGRVGSPAVVQLVTGELDPSSAVSQRVSKGVGQLGILYGVGQRFIMPFLFVVALLGLGYFRAGLAKVVCITALVVAFSYNAWAGDKTPVAMLFLLGFLAVLLMSGHGCTALVPRRLGMRIMRHPRHSKRRYLFWAGLVLLLLTLLYPVLIFFFKPAWNNGVTYVVEHIFLRIFWKPAMNSFAAIQALPGSMEFTRFADISRLATFMGWEYVDLSRDISLFKGQPIHNNAPPPAVGNFYAQGGVWVVVAGVGFAAALFKVVENFLYRDRPKTIFHVALYAMLLFGAFRFSWANFHTLLATELFLPLVVVIVGLWVLIVSMPFTKTVGATTRR